MNRLSSALRELATAFEEVEREDRWEVVSEEASETAQSTTAWGPKVRAKAAGESSSVPTKPQVSPSAPNASSKASTNLTSATGSKSPESTWGRGLEGHWVGPWVSLEARLPNGRGSASKGNIQSDGGAGVGRGLAHRSLI